MYMYHSFFYQFVCRWTSRLLPCPSYCKQCCDELWGTQVSFNSDFLSVYAPQWDCWVLWQFYFQFFKESPHWWRTLESPLDARRSNQSILKEISRKYSLEVLMLKLKFQYFGHLTQRTDSFEKTLILGKIEGERRGWQRMRWLDGITDKWTWVWVNSGSWWWTGRPGVLQSMGWQRAGHDWATELNWGLLGVLPGTDSQC